MKYKVVTLGCKVNTYESEALKTLFDKKGYTNDEENPDLSSLIEEDQTNHTEDLLEEKLPELYRLR